MQLLAKVEIDWRIFLHFDPPYDTVHACTPKVHIHCNIVYIYTVFTRIIAPQVVNNFPFIPWDNSVYHNSTSFQILIG